MKPVRAGKPQKLPEKAPAVRSHPYLTLRPYGEPRYHVSYRAARAVMVAELDALRTECVRLGASDSIAACNEAIKMIAKLGLDGGKIDALIDPFSGMKYRVELVRRKDMS